MKRIILAVMLLISVCGCQIFNKFVVMNNTNKTLMMHLSLNRRDLNWEERQTPKQILKPSTSFGVKYDIFYDTDLVLMDEENNIYKVGLPFDNDVKLFYVLTTDKDGKTYFKVDELSSKIGAKFDYDSEIEISNEELRHYLYFYNLKNK